MEVKKLQKKIEEFWEEVNRLKKKKRTPEMVFIHLVEEVGELAREFVNKKERRGEYSEEKLFDAIADILIMAFFLASLYKLDVEELLVKTLKESKKEIQEVEKNTAVKYGFLVRTLLFLRKLSIIKG
jgi:NTP pyrophosphatase (non-canonical NTP hydrolase)